MASTDSTNGGPIADVDHWEASWSTLGPPSPLPAWHGSLGKHGAFLRLLRKHAGRNVVDHARVIELGGGASSRLVALARWAGCEATALDYSPNGIAALRRMADVNGVAIDCVLGDMFTYAPAQSFDLVTHWGLLEHFERPAEVMAVSARLVRPGGVVAFGMPNMRAWGASLWRDRNPANWKLHIYHSDETVRQACADAGLELRSVFHWGVPMIKFSWDSDEAWARAMGVVQLGMYGVAKVLPVFQWGTRAISTERAFVAVRPR